MPSQDERTPLLSRAPSSSSTSSTSQSVFGTTMAGESRFSAPPLTPATSYSLSDGYSPTSSSFTCKACPAGSDFTKQVACKLTQNGEDRRVWITAHNDERCCGHEHRTLVICFDGTGDQFDESNSNIVNFVAMLRKDKNPRQIVYYQAGIGTYTDTSFDSAVSRTISMTLDQMIAWSLEHHVTAGYRFLMQNYTHGDKICIFGFSRGAYTARALAGMLQKIGLLPTHNDQQVPFAFKMYKRNDEAGYKESEHFKKTFCRAVSVHFVGVWDTVASVGLIPRYLPFTSNNSGVRHLRHALALDEHRIKFIPSFCVDGKADSNQKTDDSTQTVSASIVPAVVNGKDHDSNTKGKKVREMSASQVYESEVNKDERTDVQEVWFSGVHCDVGGGAVHNGEPKHLARIPLRWMIRECFNCNTGIVFDARMLQKVGLPIHMDPATFQPVLDPLYSWSPDAKREFPSEHEPVQLPSLRDTVWSVVTVPFKLVGSWFSKKPANSYWLLDRGHDELLDKTPDEYKEDIHDITTEQHDQMTKKALWMFMEIIPMYLQTHKAMKTGDKSYSWFWNFGKGRKIPKKELKEGWKVHRTVKMRLEWDSNYIPQARPNLWTGKIIKQDGVDKKERKPRQLTHDEWNTTQPKHFSWVPENRA